MRFCEFGKLVFEDDVSAYIEDDADHEANSALLDTLREIQFSSDHAQVPKVSVQALINLVKEKPGGEAFNLELLEKARKNNETVKNIITDIKDDDKGIKYVFIKPTDPDVAEPSEVGGGPTAGQTAPEKTVSQMAKRAAGKR